MNWTIIAILVAASLFLFLRRGGVVAPKVVAALLPQNPKIIDVRTVEEYQAGHLAQAINIPLADLGRKIGRHVPDKENPILLHCASGMRSAAGRKALEQLGYGNVHNLGSFHRARALLKQ